jgi:hypothetical protein
MRLVTTAAALASALLSAPVLGASCTPYAFTASKDQPLGCCKWSTVFSQEITTTGPVSILLTQVLGSTYTSTNYRVQIDNLTPVTKINPWDNKVFSLVAAGNRTIKVQAQSIPGAGFQDTVNKGSHLSLLVCPQ